MPKWIIYFHRLRSCFACHNANEEPFMNLNGWVLVIILHSADKLVRITVVTAVLEKGNVRASGAMMKLTAHACSRFISTFLETVGCQSSNIRVGTKMGVEFQL